MKTGPLFTKLRECDKKIIVCQGGGDAGKTVTILQHLGIDSIENRGLISTVTGQDIPNLKGGALRSFQRYVLPDIEQYVAKYNQSDRIYTFKNKSVIEFKSFENEQDARGSERDNLFMNEANAQTYQLFWQLQRKTRRKVILDYNPNAPFWCHEKILQGAERQFHGKSQLYIVDHRHNPFLTQEEHDAYESISDPDLFRVYARGLTGKIKGLVFGHFKKIDVSEVPYVKRGSREHQALIDTIGKEAAEKWVYDRIIWGLDLGYTNDPTALTKIIVAGKRRYAKEMCYEPGIHAETIKNILYANQYQPDQPLYSEPDPNMINQLRVLGIPASPAIKGPGSIAAGISKVKEHEFYYYDSPNIEKERDQYKWVMAQDLVTGKEIMTNVPVDAWNHLMDSIRMADYTDSFRHR